MKLAEPRKPAQQNRARRRMSEKEIPSKVGELLQKPESLSSLVRGRACPSKNDKKLNSERKRTEKGRERNNGKGAVPALRSTSGAVMGSLLLKSYRVIVKLLKVNNIFRPQGVKKQKQ